MAYMGFLLMTIGDLVNQLQVLTGQQLVVFLLATSFSLIFQAQLLQYIYIFSIR